MSGHDNKLQPTKRTKDYSRNTCPLNLTVPDDDGHHQNITTKYTDNVIGNRRPRRKREAYEKQNKQNMREIEGTQILKLKRYSEENKKYKKERKGWYFTLTIPNTQHHVELKSCCQRELSALNEAALI